MISLGYVKTETTNKCDKCKYYVPDEKRYKNLGEVIMCHGICDLKNTYKQRTDSCKKFEET